MVSDELHDDVLRGHEGEFLVELRLDDGGEDDEAVGDVVESNEDGVAEQEHFWNVHSSDGGIVEGALQPLVCKGVGEVGGQVAQLSAETADSLAPHGVGLVGHGGAANLGGLVRLV